MPSSEADASPYVTLAEAAEFARCSPRTIRRWIQAGDLKRYGHGGKVLVVRAELEALLASGDGGEAAP